MQDAQKPDHVTLSNLVSKLREGRYVIPDFQRQFEWRPSDIRELIRSIFLDYYIGSLLLWRGKAENFTALSCEPLYGYKGEDRPEYIVLDGQQRLTAMYYAFVGPDVPLPNRSNRYFFYVHVDKFMAEDYDEAFAYEYRAHRNPFPDRTYQFDNHIFPLSIIGATGWELPNWVQEYTKHWAAKAEDLTGEDALSARMHAQNAEKFGIHLQALTGQYQVSYIELDKELAIDKVCDIFTQINSRGVRLDVFDLVNALLKPKGLALKQLWRDAAARLDAVDVEKMNVYVLQTMSLVLQGLCSSKYLYFLLPGVKRPLRDADGTRHSKIQVPTTDDFQLRWNVAVEALEGAIGQLLDAREYGALTASFLPYVSILPVFAALRAHVRTLPAARQRVANSKLRRWYWASVFNGRYSGSTESTSARDFADVKIWFEEDGAEPALIGDFARRFRTLDLRKETQRGTSVYNGIFNLIVLQGARDWISDDSPQGASLDDHHIVPDSWGKKNLPRGLVGTVLNRTPLTAETNRKVIGSKLPNSYLPDWIAQSSEQEVRATLESHLISPAAFDILLRNPFGPDDFEAFLVERQRTILDAIGNLIVKDRLDLPVQLRALDADIERVELGLRELIKNTFGGDPAHIPQHVAQKVEERLAKAIKKSPVMDRERYSTLEGKLEYFDLRELQDSINAKNNWLMFADRFSSKETLAIKFDQLAELRNCLRHSRSVTDIVLKEGEAAILWFNQLLSRKTTTV